MTRRTALLNPLVIALATGTIVAAPAVARPADRINRFPGNGANVTPIPNHSPDVRPNVEPAAPTWPTDPQLVTMPAAPPSAIGSTDADQDDIWLAIGLGLAGAGVAAGAVGIVRARRVAA